MSARIAALYRYPVKSCGGVELQSVRLARTGLEWDRQWMVVDAAGTFLTQRTHPRLALLRPRLEGDGTLAIEAPGRPVLRVALAQDVPVDAAAAARVRVWDDRCAAVDQGDAAAAWFAEFLGVNVRLVRAGAATHRAANREYAGDVDAPLAFPDGYPVLVCNRASLEDLNARMRAPLPIERFRPNVLLEGLEPFEEDRIGELCIGDVVLRLVKPCTRCVITATDQQTGERALDPLPVLKDYRFDRRLRGVTFGENAVIVAGVGRPIAVGDRVGVTFDA